MCPGRRLTYSSNVVVLPVPANARTSMICSARRSAETIACCSCVSVLFPPSTRRVSASSRWPTAASRSAKRASSAAPGPRPLRHASLDDAATTSEIHSERHSRAHASVPTDASSAATRAASRRNVTVSPSSAAAKTHAASVAHPSPRTKRHRPISRIVALKPAPGAPTSVAHASSFGSGNDPFPRAYHRRRARDSAASAARANATIGSGARNGEDDDDPREDPPARNAIRPDGVVTPRSFIQVATATLRRACAPRASRAIFANGMNVASSTASRHARHTALASRRHASGTLERMRWMIW